MRNYLAPFTEGKNIPITSKRLLSKPSKGTFDSFDSKGSKVIQIYSLPENAIQELLPSEPQPRSCPTCARQLTSSGAYHFWCASGHCDLQIPIPAKERANHCKFCHDPLKNGACQLCEASQ
jgi:hypothetical protein